MKNIFRKRNSQMANASEMDGVEIPGENALNRAVAESGEGVAEKAPESAVFQSPTQMEAIGASTNDHTEPVFDQAQESDRIRSHPPSHESPQTAAASEEDAPHATTDSEAMAAAGVLAAPEVAAPPESEGDPETGMTPDAAAAPQTAFYEAARSVPNAPETERTDSAPVEAVEPSNSWASRYAIPGMEGILLEIQALEKSIVELEQRKAELQQGINDQERLRDILLAGGNPELTEAVQHVFGELGVQVNPRSEDQSTILLHHRGLNFVSQVIAAEGPIDLADIRRLNHRVEEFIGSYGEQPKGLLIANTFANLPLVERDDNGNVGFPESLRLLAEDRYKFCLLTTPQLFVAYCKFRKKLLNVNEFITELFETVWVYGNHRDSERFKIGVDMT